MPDRLGTLNVEWTPHGLKLRQSFDTVILNDDEQRLLVNAILSRPRPPSSPMAATPSHARWRDAVIVLADTSPAAQ